MRGEGTQFGHRTFESPHLMNRNCRPQFERPVCFSKLFLATCVDVSYSPKESSDWNGKWVWNRFVDNKEWDAWFSLAKAKGEIKNLEVGELFK